MVSRWDLGMAKGIEPVVFLLEDMASFHISSPLFGWHQTANTAPGLPWAEIRLLAGESRGLIFSRHRMIDDLPDDLQSIRKSMAEHGHGKLKLNGQKARTLVSCPRS